MIKNLSYFKYSELIFILLFPLIIFYFFNLNSHLNLNVGDQSNENILFYNHINEFHFDNANKDLTFKEYLQKKSNNFFQNNENVDFENFNENLNFNGQTYQGEEVKGLQRSIVFILNIFFNKILNIEEILFFKSLIFLLLNSSLIFYLSKNLIDKKFAYISLFFFNINPFYHQFLFASMEDQTLYFLPLFLVLNLLVLNFFEKHNKFLYQLAISCIFALGFFNGYPNSIVFLPIYFLLFLFTYFVIKIRKFKINYIISSIKIIVLTFIIYFLISGIYSIILNKDFYYHFSIIGLRFAGVVSNDNFLLNNIFSDLLIKFQNLINNIFLYDNIYHYPHEPGMLLHYPLFNYLEVFFFLLSFVYIFSKKNFSTKSFVFFISMIFFICFRFIIDDNLFINKSNFDYHILFIFFTSLGFYLFFRNITILKFFNKKIFYLINYKYFNDFKTVVLSNKSYINNKSFYYSNLLILFIFLTLIIFNNFYKFNNLYLKEFNSNLGLHNGIYEIKKILFDKNYNNENTYVILDYQKNRFDPFRPALIHQFKFNGKFITYNDYISENNYFNISNKNANEYIFIFPGFSYNSGLNSILLESKLAKFDLIYFKDLNIIKDMNGRILYYVFFVSQNENENLYEINKDIKFFERISNKIVSEKIIYVSNYNKEIRKRSGTYNDFYSSDFKNSYEIIFDQNDNITYFDSILAFIFYNDREGKNYMIFTITSDNDEIIKTVKFQSNQSEKFGVYSRLHNQFSAINYIHLSSKINNSKKIKIKIDMYNSDKKFKSSIIVNNEGLSKVHSYATLVFNDNLIK